MMELNYIIYLINSMQFNLKCLYISMSSKTLTLGILVPVTACEVSCRIIKRSQLPPQRVTGTNVPELLITIILSPFPYLDMVMNLCSIKLCLVCMYVLHNVMYKW